MAMGSGITSAVGMDADQTVPEFVGQPVQPIVSTGSVRDPASKDKIENSHRRHLTPSSSLHIHTQTMPWYKEKITHYMYDYRSQENNRWEIKDMYYSVHGKCVKVGSSDSGEKMTSSGLLFATNTQ